MPELHITEAQRERFDALREELEAEHAGPYASVRQQDVVDYLLDLAEEVDDPAGSLEAAADAAAEPADTDPGDDVELPADTADGDAAAAGRTGTSGTDTSEEAEAGAETVTSERSTSTAATGGPGGMLNLLERHDDKWREGSGEERYEVELDDGTVETARTKDDVKAILFRHY